MLAVAVFFAVWLVAMEAGLHLMGFEGVALYETGPDGFYRMRPEIRFMGGGETNRLGLRGDLPENPGLVLLGDSVVFGFNLRVEQTVPAELARLTGYPVLNAGVPGYGAREPRLLVQRVMKDLSVPRWAIVLTVNDVTEASDPLPPPAFWIDTRERHSPLRLREFAVLMRHYAHVMRVRLLPGTEQHRWEHRITGPEKAVQWVAGEMEKLRAALPAPGSLAVALAPWKPGAEGRNGWIGAFAEAGGHDLLAPALAARNLTVWRTDTPPFPAGSFLDDVHLSPLGTRELASRLAGFLSGPAEPSGSVEDY